MPEKVLHRTADAHGNIDLWADGNAGNTHLATVRRKASIHSAAGCPQGAAQLLGKAFQFFKTFL